MSEKVTYRGVVVVEGQLTSEDLFQISQLLPDDTPVNVFTEGGNTHFAAEKVITSE